MKFVLGLWAAILIGIVAKIPLLTVGGLFIWIIMLIAYLFGGGGGGGSSSNHDNGSIGTQGWHD